MFNKTVKTYIFKKRFKLKLKNLKYTAINLGIASVRTLQSMRLKPNQMESLRRVFVRATMRFGRIWLRTGINYLLTKKSQGSRMGKGIGSVKDWVIEVKTGQQIIEFSFVEDVDVLLLLSKLSKKMPVKVEYVLKNFKY